MIKSNFVNNLKVIKVCEAIKATNINMRLMFTKDYLISILLLFSTLEANKDLFCSTLTDKRSE